MLQHINKKKPPKLKFDAPVTGQTACGACSYVRKPADTCPDWQCPGCGKAYSKVNAQKDEHHLSQAELRRKNTEYLQSKPALSGEEATHPAVTGIGIGIATFLHGIGTACAAANPVVQIAGIAIVLGSLIYGLSSFWS
jgi:hypothetical protein